LLVESRIRRNSDSGRQHVRGNEEFKRELKPEEYIKYQGNSDCCMSVQKWLKLQKIKKVVMMECN